MADLEQNKQVEDLIILLPEERDILDDGRAMLREQIVSHQGRWKINLNDPDPWPSDPHGDRQDEPEKLDIYTGDVFSKINRNHIYSLSKKSMKFIYRSIMSSKHEKVKQQIILNKALLTYIKIES